MSKNLSSFAKVAIVACFLGACSNDDPELDKAIAKIDEILKSPDRQDFVKKEIPYLDDTTYYLNGIKSPYFQIFFIKSSKDKKSLCAFFEGKRSNGQDLEKLIADERCMPIASIPDLKHKIK